MACACKTKDAVKPAPDSWKGTLTVRHEPRKATVADHLWTTILGVIAFTMVLTLVASLVRR